MCYQGCWNVLLVMLMPNVNVRIACRTFSSLPAPPPNPAGADFNNTFRRLAMVPLPPPSNSSGNNTGSNAAAAAANGASPADAAAAAAVGGSNDQPSQAQNGTSNGNGSNGSSSGVDDDDSFGGFLPLQLSELASPAEMAAGAKPSMPLDQVQVGFVVLGVLGFVLVRWRRAGASNVCC